MRSPLQKGAVKEGLGQFLKVDYNAPMVTNLGAYVAVRRAEEHDAAAVMAWVDELDLGYAGLRFDSFWVAVQQRELRAFLRLQDLGDHAFLSALGSVPSCRGQGFARALIEGVLAEQTKRVYLYTVIPAFFSRFGFRPSTIPDWLESKARFECHRCQPDLCRCLVYEPLDGVAT